MIDFTKATSITDFAGNVVPAEFMEKTGAGGLNFKVIGLHNYKNYGLVQGSISRVFNQDGSHRFGGGLKLNPPTEATPPVWALKKACRTIEFRYDSYVKRDLNEWLAASIKAHAATIAANEDEPVDEHLLIAREICAEYEGENKAYQFLDGSRDDYREMEIAVLALKRGITLAQSGGA